MPSIELVDVAMRLVERAEGVDVGQRKGVDNALESCGDALECLYAAMMEEGAATTTTVTAAPGTVDTTGTSETELRAVIDRQVGQLELLVSKTTEMREENSRLIELLASPLDTSGVIRAPTPMRDAHTDNPRLPEGEGEGEGVGPTDRVESIERESRSRSRNPAAWDDLRTVETQTREQRIEAQDRRERGEDRGRVEVPPAYRSPATPEALRHTATPDACLPLDAETRSVGTERSGEAVAVAAPVFTYRYDENKTRRALRQRQDDERVYNSGRKQAPTTPTTTTATTTTTTQQFEWGYRYSPPGRETAPRTPPTLLRPCVSEATTHDGEGDETGLDDSIMAAYRHGTALPTGLPTSPVRGVSSIPTLGSPSPLPCTPVQSSPRRDQGGRGGVDILLLPSTPSRGDNDARATYFQTGDLHASSPGSKTAAGDYEPVAPSVPPPLRSATGKPLYTGDLLKPVSSASSDSDRGAGTAGTPPTASYPLPKEAPSLASESRLALDSFLSTVRPDAGPKVPSPPMKAAKRPEPEKEIVSPVCLPVAAGETGSVRQGWGTKSRGSGWGSGSVLAAALSGGVVVAAAVVAYVSAEMPCEWDAFVTSLGWDDSAPDHPFY